MYRCRGAVGVCVGPFSLSLHARDDGEGDAMHKSERERIWKVGNVFGIREGRAECSRAKLGNQDTYWMEGLYN